MNIIIAFLLAFSAFSATTEEIAQTAKLREEVELLAHEVEALKKTQQAEMDVYIQRFQEISAQTLREKFRQDQLKTQIKLGQKKLETQMGSKVSIQGLSWLKEFWGQYEQSLQMANPIYAVKLKERVAKLKLDLEMKKISYEHALLQAWFVLESDLNKAQEAEFALTSLELDGKLYHVEMVRLGRTLAYFRTADAKYGLMMFTDKWFTQFLTDSASKSDIETLLTQFKQQQKTGLHRLPEFNL